MNKKYNYTVNLNIDDKNFPFLRNILFDIAHGYDGSNLIKIILRQAIVLENYANKIKEDVLTLKKIS